MRRRERDKAERKTTLPTRGAEKFNAEVTDILAEKVLKNLSSIDITFLFWLSGPQRIIMIFEFFFPPVTQNIKKYCLF